MTCDLSAGKEAGWEDITIHPELYKAATEGDIDTLKKCDKCLDLLGTPIGNTILHIYLATTKERSTDFVQKILKLCPSLLWKANNSNGDIPLHVAARYGRAEIVKALISQVAEHHQSGESGVSPVREMLSMTNKKKDTALHEAARNNCIAVVKVLTQCDPNLEYFPSDCGETPIYLAAAGGHDSVVQEMLRTCTSPAYDGPNGITALHAAVIASFYRKAKSVNEDDANDTSEFLYKQWRDAMTTLHAAVITPFQRKTKFVDEYGSNTIGEILQKQKSLSCAADNEGWTPLHYAAYVNNSLAAKTILTIDKSAAYASNNPRKMTALHLAASRDKVETLKEIILQCPDCCELVDARGWNVLHYAGLTQSTSVIRAVLRNPSLYYLVNQADAKGKTPLHLHAAVFQPEDPTSLSLNYIGLLEGNKVLLNSPQEQEEASKCLEDLRSAPMGKIVTIVAGQMRLHRNQDEIIQSIDNSKDAQLVVATLIATVTFAAAFTVPGGLRSDNSDRKQAGTAVLGRNAAFQAFFITDALALVLATSSILTHFHLRIFGYRHKYEWMVNYSHTSIILAAEAMTLAFATGAYAILAPTKWLAILICVIGVSCILFLRCRTNVHYKCRWNLLNLWYKYFGSGFKK